MLELKVGCPADVTAGGADSQAQAGRAAAVGNESHRRDGAKIDEASVGGRKIGRIL